MVLTKAEQDGSGGPDDKSACSRLWKPQPRQLGVCAGGRGQVRGRWLEKVPGGTQPGELLLAETWDGDGGF